MDGYRKLLILATNELLSRNLISLSGDNDATNHIITKIAGEDTAICWSGIGYQELRISVWWKYDHSHHPQANLEGNSQERFRTSLPLAKRQHYPKFVGVAVSGWLERNTGKHLQGKGRKNLFDIYARRGEREALEAIPNPIAKGFQPEGKFFL